ncbi:MAG: hypothetical protein CMJ39_07245 [Phycisphaerae bacterium]|nr:hypothetical protein [Phycisphaerae bacterium]|tara:strand:- start:1139 stop:1429 length:291 start_codon:yes stop_codon:yes gene_type:complete
MSISHLSDEVVQLTSVLIFWDIGQVAAALEAQQLVALAAALEAQQLDAAQLEVALSSKAAGETVVSPLGAQAATAITKQIPTVASIVFIILTVLNR